MTLQILFRQKKKSTGASKRNFVINTISPSWDGSKSGNF